MKPLLKKILIILAFAVNIGLTLYGFLALLDSPYTGIRMSVCGDHACVKSVDNDSPAYGKIKPGDSLVDVDGRNISYLAFHEDPDYIRAQLDLDKFWIATQKLNEIVIKRSQVELSIERGGRRLTVFLSPAEFPLKRVLLRTIPVYFVGWTCLIVAYLILRKKTHEISVAFMILGVSICTSFTAANTSAVRDIVYPYVAFKVTSMIDFIALLGISSSYLHLILIFPQRRKILINYAWIIKGLYIIYFLLGVMHFMKVFDTTYITTYGPLTVSVLTALFVPSGQYFIEKNAVLKQQIKWVFAGMLTAAFLYGSMSAIPIMFGVPFVSVEISGLVAVLIPLSFAFAITKYRLMEIDNILDTAVVYGFTILVLAGIETTFLSFASPYLLTAGKGLPALSVIAVLLIVFIYVPIRNAVKGFVERLFKRGKYDPEKELQQFTVSLGLCDERSALEKFTAFVKDLLRPSGIVVLKIGDRTASILHASNDLARQEGERIVSQTGEVWQHVRNKGTCTFGYELSEKIGQDGALFTPDLENALFIPFITDPADTRSGYLAVLLKKWNETAYSIKDVTLLNSISVNIANIIEAGELRKERDAIEGRFRKEKDAVMKELHDGLGNILTSITVTSQAAERLLEGAKDKARELVSRIGEFSAEAMDFMRTGLTVLDNPLGDIGSLMEAIRDRFGDMFESSGMELSLECSDDAVRLRPGAMVALNITRVIQEALSNIMKHSGARRASIRMDVTESVLAVTIEDDGTGFQPGAEEAGYGIKNMRRRIADMNGALEVASLPGRGTEVKLIIPLAERKGETPGAYALGNR